MSFLERVATGKIVAKKEATPSKWNLIRDIRDFPDKFQLRAFFERGGITVRVEPRQDLDNLEAR